MTDNPNKYLGSADLDNFPRLGWISEATPITELPQFAEDHGAEWVGCKRDDQTSGLHGGSKVRKLDFLLASSPFKESESWATMGAIGSGHMVASCTAAERLNRKIHAHLFWEPISDGVLDNLAFTVTHSESLHYYSTRISMAFRKPATFLSGSVDGSKIIPFGATNPVGILGLVRAGLELGEQVRNGELPEPKRIYVALGTGGTVAGLAIGIALGGLSSTIHAVSTVEWIISTPFRMRSLLSETRKLLAENGHRSAIDIPPAKIVFDRSQLGKGYGFTTPSSLHSVELMQKQGLKIEPVYTGKMVAAMQNDLQSGVDGPILFWNSMRRELPEISTFWKNKLPPELQRRLDEQR
ncbi:MAG: pyridoxal-phosphate dependent enzyme [Flavobacteriales bacterium]|nr:pyridoxal-phosphate dependent enzyme [Flavobacteriales bacterium]